MLRRIVWLAPVVLLAAHAFLGMGPGDYRQGYDKALQDLQDTRFEVGAASELGAEFIGRFDRLGEKETLPDRWQDGYRQALRDHLHRQQRER